MDQSDVMETLASDGPRRQDETIAALDDTNPGDHIDAIWPPGYVFGKYSVIRRIGAGTSAIVYLAEDRRLGRNVAVKVSLRKLEKSDAASQRFYREATSVARLQHANVCQVHDIGRHDGRFFIAMSYIDGPTLSEWLQTTKPDEQQTIRIIRSLALALQEAHEHGIIHRDLKPANILLNKRDAPVLTDFGLALSSMSDVSSRITQPGLIVGSPAYMSPEQVRDASNVTTSTDIYSLGVVMYQMLCGQLPFTGELMTVLRKIALNEPAAPSSCAGVSKTLSAICMRAMAKDPANRFANMAEFAAALRPVMRSTDAVMIQRNSIHICEAKQRARPKKSLNTSLWAGAVTLLAVIASLGVLIHSRRNADRSEVSADVGKPSRLARLNMLLQHGLHFESDFEEYRWPLEEIPDDILSVSTLEMRHFGSEELQELFEVLPKLQRLSICTDELTEEGWNCLLKHYPPELAIEAKLLREQEWGVIARMFDLQSLEITSREMTDSDLKALRSLTSLEALVLPFNEIKGSFLQDLVGLYQLAFLDLTDSRITDESLVHLQAFPRLSLVSLAGTPITGVGLKHLSRVRSLDSLNVGYTGLGNQALDQIAQFPKITSLNLEGCTKITDLTPLSETRICDLHIGGSSVTDLKPVMSLPLIELSVGDDFAGDLTALNEIPTLRILEGLSESDLQVDFGNSLGDGFDDFADSRLTATKRQFSAPRASRLEQLSKLCLEARIFLLVDTNKPLKLPLQDLPTEIWAVNAESRAISDEQLERLFELAPRHNRLHIRTDRLSTNGWKTLLRHQKSELLIEAEDISPEHLEYIGRMHQVQNLEIRSASINDEDVKAIASLRNLTMLSLYDLNITGACFPALAEMKRLETLDLVGSRITDDHLADLPDLPLKVLNLCYTDVDGSGIPHLARFKDLRYLNLAGTRVDDSTLPNVLGLPALEELVIHDVSISDLSVLTESSLEAINLSGTDVRDWTPLKSMGLKRLVVDEEVLLEQRSNFPSTLEELNELDIQSFRASSES
ncbi:MAG: protein kinase [Planctomycetota bacterium]